MFVTGHVILWISFLNSEKIIDSKKQLHVFSSGLDFPWVSHLKVKVLPDFLGAVKTDSVGVGGRNVDKVIHNWQEDIDILESNNLAVKISYSGGNF